MPNKNKTNNNKTPKVTIKEVVVVPTNKQRQRKPRKQRPPKNTARYSNINATEMLTPVTVSETDATSTVVKHDFNPSTSGALLTKLSTVYDCIRIRNLRVCFKGYLGSQASGNVAFGIDYDPNKAAPKALSGVASLQPNTMTSPSKTSRWIKLDPRIIKPGVVYKTSGAIFSIMLYATHEKLAKGVELGCLQVQYDIELSGVDP